MKKILVLPLFKMPSGHHHVAEALIDSIKTNFDDFICMKLDFLSFVSPVLEKLVATLYLKWIHFSPVTYNRAYYLFSYTRDDTSNLSLVFYEKLFLRRMEKLIARENPDLIICTHGFPSFLISRLKGQGRVKVPVINVYTDFFINSVWGKKEIDYHLVPDHSSKVILVEKYAVSAKNIKVSGVPIHEKLRLQAHSREENKSLNILVSGGSSGLGDIETVLSQASGRSLPAKFTILCGNNKTLYEHIQNLNSPFLHPVTYLSSKEEMNRLYDQADAIITKPGGVTVSESLHKRLPIFIHSVLPGQEDVNLQTLLARQLVYKLSKERPYIDQITATLQDDKEMEEYKKRVDDYRHVLELKDTKGVSGFIKGILSGEEQEEVSEYVHGNEWKLHGKVKERFL